MCWDARVGLGLALCLLFTPAALLAQPLTLEYTFDRPEVAPVKLGSQLYDRVSMPGVPNCGNPGEPALPASGAQILLPFGTEVARVEIVPGESVSLGSGYLIEPVGRPVRLSAGPQAATPPTPDPAIYGADQPFPQTTFEQIGTYGLRGYQMLILKLHPVQYVPASGELLYYPRLTVIVHTIDSGNFPALFRGLAKDRAEVLDRVDNPHVADTYPVAGTRGGGYDLLILTTPALASTFQPLKDYHDAHNLPTEIHTTTDVGSNDPDDIRDYITDRYNNDGIEYVIIGGDDDLIPAKDLYVDSLAGPVEDEMPGDIYFSCLDGTWNYDGDNRWGEPNDGPGGGDVDLVADVFVGRACAGNTTEAGRFVDKTIWYLTGQHGHMDGVLMVGEHLGFGGVAEYAGWMLDQLIDGSNADGYTTIGIPSDIYSVDRLYDRDWAGHNWPQSELVTRINNGLHLLDHLGHGSPSYAMKLDSGDILNLLHNDDLCFVYSQTCSAGHFDGTDCWAEYMNIKTDHGGFGVVMNARYGWGTYYSTDGPSHRFNRQFWDAVYNPAENKPELGRANADSKEDNLYRVNQGCMRWCYYELTLFGDPTLAVRGVTGLRVTPSTELVAEGPRGGPFTPDSISYTLENMGEDGFDYSVTHDQPWVSVTNATGYLAPGATTTVTVSINDNANSLPDGSYDDTVEFVNSTSHEGDTSREVTLNVGIPQVVYEWTLDTNPGWSAQSQWAWGHPTGSGGEYGGPDPTNGHTGTNVCGYNLNGDYPNNMPEYHLTSDAIDCSGLANVHLKFWRWLGVEQPAYDHAYVRVSNDGSNWVTVWENPAEITDSSWVEMNLDISDVADDQWTVYLRWTMGTTDGGWRYCGWNIDDIQIIALGGEPPALSILLPEGVPERLSPGVGTDITVQIVDGEETYVPGTGTLHYRYSGSTFNSVAVTPLGGNLYQATLPPANCEATPEFYFAAQGDGGTTVLNPRNAPDTCYQARVGVFTIYLDDDCETNTGWTVGDIGDDATTGIWDRADPEGTIAQPEDDHTPTPGTDCWVTDHRRGSGAGSWDVDDGKTTVKSPVLDLSEFQEVTISYWRWYSNNAGASPNADIFVVDVTNDAGQNWTRVETVGPAGPGTSGGWIYHEFEVTDFIVLNDQVRLRFVASDEGAGSLVEAAIDDFFVEGFACEMPFLPGDLNCDGVLDAFDIDPFVLALTDPVEYANQYPDCDVMLADVNGDGVIDSFDIDPFVELLTGP